MKNLIVIFILSFLFIGCIPTQYPEVSILTETETRLLVKVETDSTEIVNESIINSNLVDFTIWDSVDFKDFTSPSVFMEMIRRWGAKRRLRASRHVT